MRRGEGEGIPCHSQPLGSLGGKEPGRQASAGLPPPRAPAGPRWPARWTVSPGGVCRHACARAAAEEGPEEEEAWGGGRGQLGSVGCWAARQK